MQAMLGLDMIGFAFFDASLWAVGLAGTALDAGIGNLESLDLWLGIPHGIVIAFDGMHSEVEVFYLSLTDAEDNADAACVARINIGEIGLLFEDDILPMFLFVIGHGLGNGREANHLLELGQGMNLYMSIGEQLTAEILVTGCIEIDGIGLIVDS